MTKTKFPKPSSHFKVCWLPRYFLHIWRASVGWPSSYSTFIQAASLPSPAATVRIGPLCHHGLSGPHDGCIAAGCQAPSLAQPESPWEGKCYLNVNPSNSRVPRIKCNFWTSLHRITPGWPSNFRVSIRYTCTFSWTVPTYVLFSEAIQQKQYQSMAIPESRVSPKKDIALLIITCMAILQDPPPTVAQATSG